MRLARRKDYAGSHIFGCSASPVVYPRSCPPDPPRHVRPELGGGTRLLRLLLVKPDRRGNEILDRLGGHAQAVRAEVIG